MRIRHPLRAAVRALYHRAPIEAQLIVTRRCNLSCGYCSEYDDFSPPVPLALLRQRIDALHRLRAVNIALLGGEPLLHPDIGEIVAYAGRRAEVSLTTNGFLLSDEMIGRLNRAGLCNLQVSIDRLRPDGTGYIQKSLRTLTPKLRRLRELARFGVHVTVVLCEQSKPEFREMLRALAALDLPVSVNLIHDAGGGIAVQGAEYLELWDEHYRSGRPFLTIEYEYGRQLLLGRRPEWRCRAGSRFLYVDEAGNVQYCSAQRGRLGKPVTEYGPEDLRAQSRTRKGCEQGCSLLCVYRDSQLDNAPVEMVRNLYRSVRDGLLGTPAAGARRPAPAHGRGMWG